MAYIKKTEIESIKKELNLKVGNEEHSFYKNKEILEISKSLDVLINLEMKKKLEKLKEND
ncbi:MAG: hypothetical protein N4A54_14085 [Peptostreptococcaceae bacterium]|nr:hypothetical protein [Peptostreptococcaceae bacterium]